MKKDCGLAWHFIESRSWHRHTGGGKYEMHMWKQLETWQGSPALLFHVVGSPARCHIGVRGWMTEGLGRFMFPMLCRKGHFACHSYAPRGGKAVTPPAGMFSPNIHTAVYTAASTSAFNCCCLGNLSYQLEK